MRPGDTGFDDLRLVDPESGAALCFTLIGDEHLAAPHGVWQAGEGTRWPQIDNVVYLRAGCGARAEAAVESLQAGDVNNARARLLADVDDHAPAAPGIATAAAVADDVQAGRCGAREAMQRLAYGPVADYFGLRGSTPTFLSGLELLAQGVDADDRVVEIACGVGHFLHHLQAHSIPTLGLDVTFSKLWLARHFMVGADVPLICVDISAGAASGLQLVAPANVFCHDAFYFFADKPSTAKRLSRLAGEAGRVLLGHVHLADGRRDHVGGDLLTASGYADLFEDVRACFDDAAMSRGVIAGEPAEPCPLETLGEVDAITLIAGSAPAAPARRLRELPDDQMLYANPLLSVDGAGRLLPNWPSKAFAAEYADSDYLAGAPRVAVDELPRRGRDLPRPMQQQRLVLPAAFVAMAVRPVRWAIIGCGWVARDYVVPGLAHAPSATLAALCDPDAARRAQCAGATTAVPGYDDAAAMLAAEAVDAVYIATPNDSHAELTQRAAAAGCHVYCEKPLATTVADAQAMVEACRRANVRLATAFDQRFHEAHHVLRAAVAEGRLGAISQVRMHYACQVDAAWSATPGDTDNWRLQRARAGGGAVIDLAPHMLDLLSFVVGDEPEALSLVLQGRCGAQEPADAVDAGGVLTVRTHADILASVHVSYQCPEYLPRREIELIGSHGGARAINTLGQTPGGHIEWHTPDGSYTQDFADDPALSPFARQIEAFSAALIADRPWPFTAARDLEHFQQLQTALADAEADRAPRRRDDDWGKQVLVRK